MSLTPPAGDPSPQPSAPRPAGPPLPELAAAVVVSAPVGFLIDWPTAVETLITVFAAMISVRQVSDPR
ncbi:hypothetical protein [Nocardia iowensis]|uniref:Uncharacterized protein n=1 Tax=Nocardia iowensis TaxID=204891 RepID=A0ABX8RWZ2_NOCIO|nr:hypothetical protein [Nocardia iowensis]QXN94173.1 hypothetical protein KV110_14570 [Nocardia iowensis]